MERGELLTNQYKKGFLKLDKSTQGKISALAKEFYERTLGSLHARSDSKIAVQHLTDKEREEYKQKFATAGELIGRSLKNPKTFSRGLQSLNDLAIHDPFFSKSFLAFPFQEILGAFSRAIVIGKESLVQHIGLSDTPPQDSKDILNYFAAVTVIGGRFSRKAAVDALVSPQAFGIYRTLLGNRIISPEVATYFTAIHLRGSLKHREKFKTQFVKVLNDPNFDFESLAALANITSSKNRRENKESRQHGLAFIRYILEAYHLPSDCIDRWLESHKKPEQGVFRNLEAIVKLERRVPGITAALHHDFGLRFFARYPEELLVKQYEERESQDPYGVVLYPGFEDDRGAFYKHRPLMNKFENLTEDFEGKTLLRFVEGSTKVDLSRRFHRLDRSYGRHNKISFCIINGHGSEDLLRMGRSASLIKNEKKAQSHHITAEDIRTGIRDERFSLQYSFFKKDAVFFIASCKGGVEFAKAFSEAYPHADVYAPINNVYLQDIAIADESKNNAIMPVFSSGNLWVQYKDGQMSEMNTHGILESELTIGKRAEISLVLGVLEKTPPPLSAIEQQVFTARLESYLNLIVKNFDPANLDMRPHWSLLSSITAFAQTHLPGLRSRIAEILDDKIKDFDTLIGSADNEMDREESLRMIEDYVWCAPNDQKVRGLEMLKKHWNIVLEWIEEKNHTADMLNYISVVLEYGDPDFQRRVRIALLENFRRFSAIELLIAGLLSQKGEACRTLAHEFISRLFPEWKEQDCIELTRHWVQKEGDGRYWLISGYITSMGDMERQKRGITYFLYKEYGIKNFWLYPVRLLIAQYEGHDDATKPHGIILYPQEGIVAKIPEVAVHELMFSDFSESLGSDVAIRVYEYADEKTVHEIFEKIHAVNGNDNPLAFALIGGAKSSAFSNPSNFFGISRGSPEGLYVARKYFRTDATIILDVPRGGEPHGFAQKLSECLRIPVFGPRENSHLTSLKAVHKKSGIGLLPRYAKGKFMRYEKGKKG